MTQNILLLSLDVSIQLISPASGEWQESSCFLEGYKSFHSINFPSEWGVEKSEVEWSREEKRVFPFN